MAVIDQQLRFGAGANDLDVAVRRFRLVQLLAVEGAANATAGQDRQADDQDRNQEIQPPRPCLEKAQRRDYTKQDGKHVDRRPRSERRNQPEHRQERPQDAAQRRECIDGAGGVAGGLELANSKPDDKGRNHAEEDHRNGKQDDDGDQRTEYQPDRELGEAGLRQ